MDDDVSNEQAEAAMTKFAEITGTDIVYAQSILQDVNWNVDVSSLISEPIFIKNLRPHSRFISAGMGKKKIIQMKLLEADLNRLL